MKAILDAANAEIAAHGYFGAQMTMIAGRAGVSPGSVYRFFPDKDALCAALAQAHLDAVTARFDSVARSFQSFDDLGALVSSLLVAVAELQEQYPGYYRMTNDVSPLGRAWVENSVRSLIVENLTALLVSKGITAADDAPDLATVVEFTFETVRCRLATIPTDQAVRTRLIDELTWMLTRYATGRLRHADV